MAWPLSGFIRKAAVRVPAGVIGNLTAGEVAELLDAWARIGQTLRVHGSLCSHPVTKILWRVSGSRPSSLTDRFAASLFRRARAEEERKAGLHGLYSHT